MLKRIGMLALLASCAFAGGLAAVYLGPRSTPTVIAQSPPPPVLQSLTALSQRFEMIATKVSPAVVSIEATKPPAAGKTRPQEESGSGVIIRGEEGKNVYVLTNNHVISGAKPEQITISLSDNRVFRASQVWADPESDVAVLRVDRGDLPTAKLGASSKVRVGQWVVAIGSPFGLSQSVTHGIISARERGQISLGGTIRIKEFLQTDAPINPGSSGGPLFDLDGNVIGINTAIASHSGSNSGVSFSIPINLVKRVARELFEKGTVTRGYLGLQMAAVFEANDALRLGLDRAQGALVETVYPNTPAATAGLKASDVVLQVDSVPVRHENHFINLISAMPAGRRVRLQVWRDRRSIWVDAVVGDWSRGQTGLRTGP